MAKTQNLNPNRRRVPDFPSCVLTDILSRLQVKSLLRFKCVSKQWGSLINSRHFIKLQIDRSIATRTNHRLILRDSNLYSVDLDAPDSAAELNDHPIKISEYGIDVLGSCDGLLCLLNIEDEIAFWNIETKEYRVLPVTDIEFPEYFNFWQFMVYGFGRDYFHDDYKLVRIVQFLGEGYDSFDNEVKVYSLNSNSWRRIRECPYYFKYKLGWGVFVCGSLHWVLSRKPDSGTDSFVLALDLADEDFKEVPLPDFYNEEFHMSVGVLEGNLCLVCNYSKVRLDMWVMVDYGVDYQHKFSWFKFFSISQPEVIGSFEFLEPLAFSKTGWEVLLNQDGKSLLWYDIEEKTVRNARIRGVPNSFEVVICVRSLARLNGGHRNNGQEQLMSKKKKKKKNKKNKKRCDSLLEEFSLGLNCPAEMIVDTLSRLPAKTLLRFKCVCKAWCALICDPEFIKKNLKRSVESNTNLSLILIDSYLYYVDFNSFDIAVELDHPLKSPFYGTDVLGSCNGLLCLYNWEEEIVLWNPSTRKLQYLPTTHIELPEYFTFCQYIIYGFGYDHMNDDYKVVRIVQFYGEDSNFFDNEVKVYSVKNNSWRRIQDMPYYLRHKRAWGIFVCGALHWVVTRTPESDSSNIIVGFDLGAEEYREIPLPDFLDRDFHMNVELFGGQLCILCNYHKVQVDVWVMKDYMVKGAWTKLFSITQPRVIKSFDFIRPLAYSKSGNEVLLQQDNKKLLWYDLKKKRTKNASIYGMPSSFHACLFVGSLVALHSDGVNKMTQEKKKTRKNRKKRDDVLPAPAGFKLVWQFSLDLIGNILSQLPVKTLLRFKCVSKPWRSLIDNPDFVRRHLEGCIESNTNRILILRDSFLHSVDFDLLDKSIVLDHPLKSEFCAMKIVGSCDGLLCLYKNAEDVVLWNPSTRKSWKLPVSPVEFTSHVTCCQYIIYGFGYDALNHGYKVVRIAQFYGGDDDSFGSEVKVFSLKSNSWHRIRKFPGYLRYEQGWGVLASGALHWVVTRKPDSDTLNVIVAFDLGFEQYREVPQPTFTDANFHMNLAVLGGNLCILCNYYKVRLDVWVMNDYAVRESWTRLCSITQPKIIRSFDYVRPLAYSKSGNEVLFEQDNKKLAWYDLQKNIVKNVNISGGPDSFDAEICIASLVPLCSEAGYDGEELQGNRKKKDKKIRDDFLSVGFKLVL